LRHRERLPGGLLRRCDWRHLLKRMLRGLGHDSEEVSPCHCRAGRKNIERRREDVRCS
jgi:hypothetical protein